MDSDSEVRFIADSLRDLKQLVWELKEVANELRLTREKLDYYQALDDVIRELTEILSEQIPQLQSTILLLLEIAEIEKEESADEIVTGPLRSEFIEDRIKTLKKKKKIFHDHRNKLEEQEAIYGAVPPPELAQQLNIIQDKINQVDQELAYYRSKRDEQ